MEARRRSPSAAGAIFLYDSTSGSMLENCRDSTRRLTAKSKVRREEVGEEPSGEVVQEVRRRRRRRRAADGRKGDILFRREIRSASSPWR